MDIDVFALILAVLLAVLIEVRSRSMSPYKDRPCMGRSWKKAFPDSSSSNIRLFLECLVDGMALPQDKLSFGPDDKVIDVYRSLYGGRRPIIDNLECECFLLNLEDCFGVAADTIEKSVGKNENLTLGDIYAFLETEGKRIA